jgi:hypothetical protein
MELKGKTKMKHTLFLLIFTYATVLNAQRCLCGMDSLSYVQGYIDGKFKNNYQVFLRSEDKLVTTPGNYSLREYFTLVIPRGPYFLLLFKNPSGWCSATNQYLVVYLYPYFLVFPQICINR